jgi:hypothetical protein
LNQKNNLAASPAKALANTLKSWLELIVRMWRFSRSIRAAEEIARQHSDNRDAGGYKAIAEEKRGRVKQAYGESHRESRRLFG